MTSRGGLASHAAVVARGWGIPAVVGAGEVELVDGGIRIGERFLAAGEEISIDGRTGEVLLGSLTMTTAEAPAELEDLLRWADVVREGLVAVRVNADTAEDAAHARHLGAQGIGLCRTEHMFLADDRLPLVRRFILTDDAATEAAALADLEAAQQQDFEGILSAMDGLPVTVRLLDPPLHEFLPDHEKLIAAEAKGELDCGVRRAELAAVRRLHETNPSDRHARCRLGVVGPGRLPDAGTRLCRSSVLARQGPPAPGRDHDPARRLGRRDEDGSWLRPMCWTRSGWPRWPPTPPASAMVEATLAPRLCAAHQCRGRFLLLRNERSLHPAHLRLQPRRRRGAVAAHLSRDRHPPVQPVREARPGRRRSVGADTGWRPAPPSPT
ncbi:MAG: putative PEP-binding protein [Ilumatobacteraceae bacterium]